MKTVKNGNKRIKKRTFFKWELHIFGDFFVKLQILL